MLKNDFMKSKIDYSTNIIVCIDFVLLFLEEKVSCIELLIKFMILVIIILRYAIQELVPIITMTGGDRNWFH